MNVDAVRINSAGMSIALELFELEQTDNGPRPEDGPQQNVSQSPEVIYE